MFITEPEMNVNINIDTVCNTVARMSAQLRNVRVGMKVPVILGRSCPPHRQSLPPGGDPPLLKTVMGNWAPLSTATSTSTRTRTTSSTT